MAALRFSVSPSDQQSMSAAVQRLNNYCHLLLNEVEHSGKPWDAFPSSVKSKTIAEGFGWAQWLVLLASSKWCCTNIGFCFIGEQLCFSTKVLYPFDNSAVSIKCFQCLMYCTKNGRETVKLFCYVVKFITFWIFFMFFRFKKWLFAPFWSINASQESRLLAWIN